MTTNILAALKLGLVWVASLLVLGFAAATLAQAQMAGNGRVVSGSDLGFRVDGERNGLPIGRFVVRIDGQWVEVRESVAASRLSQ